MIRRRILFSALLAALFALGWWVGRGGASGDLYANLDLFVEVLHKIEDNYVDPVDPRRMIEGALKGMLKELDPYSQYLDQKAYTSLQDVTHGKFSGIGVVVSVRDHYPTVISPIEGSPAWTAGLQSGDVLVRIDGKSTADFTVDDAAQLLRGAEGTQVRVTVRREGDDAEREFVLRRGEIVTKSVPYAFVTEGGAGYLRLANFSETSGAEVRAATERLRRQGARTLILDMRSNPGGLLDQAVDVAEQFLPEGALVVYTRGRGRGQDNRFYASGARSETRWPMVVLVDRGSASASEIVAGALQDRDRALLIGRTSFGKGSVQSVFPLRGRAAALKLTTARYYTPSGRSIHRATRDSLEDEDEDLSESDEPAGGTNPSPEAAGDTVSRPVFHTAGGRLVEGGGGIKPDLEVPEDTIPPLTLRVEQRGLPFRFANRWINTHPGAKRTASPNGAVWDDFVAFLRVEKVPIEEHDLAAEREVLERSLQRELARRAGGDSAAARAALPNDPVFRRAIEVLGRARSATDVFAGAVPQNQALGPGLRPSSPRTGKAPAPVKRPPGKRSRTSSS